MSLSTVGWVKGMSVNKGLTVECAGNPAPLTAELQQTTLVTSRPTYGESLLKKVKVLIIMKNSVAKGENILVMRHFSFCHNVLRHRLLPVRLQVGKGLMALK